MVTQAPSTSALSERSFCDTFRTSVAPWRPSSGLVAKLGMPSTLVEVTHHQPCGGYK